MSQREILQIMQPGKWYSYKDINNNMPLFGERAIRRSLSSLRKYNEVQSKKIGKKYNGMTRHTWLYQLKEGI
jgi:hypothetical protein